MQESEIGEIVAKHRDLRRFSDQPVAEIVQCGEPIFFGLIQVQPRGYKFYSADSEAVNADASIYCLSSSRSL